MQALAIMYHDVVENGEFESSGFSGEGAHVYKLRREDFERHLDAIAAAVIGGTSLSGGEGSILGTIIGAFIISTLTNGLRILSVPQEWQTVVTGTIVVFAVYLDILRRRRSQT